MLVAIGDSKFCAWHSFTSHSSLISSWNDIPPRIRVGSVAVGLLASNSVATQRDTLVYVGKKIITSVDGSKKRQIRLFLMKGTVGFIEGFDVKFLEPVDVQTQNF